MKKLNIHSKIVILISLLLVSVNISYSQWTIVGDLAAIIGPRPIVSVVDGNTAFVTGGDTINATYKTTNGGTNWIQLNTSIFRPFWSICAKDANTVFAGDNGNGGRINFYKTTNGGINWTLIDSISGVTANNNGFRGIRFSNSIPSFGIAYAEGNNGDFYIYKTRDGGNIWTRSLIPGYPGYRITGGLNVIDSLFYAFGTFVGPPSMIITTDGGVTWNLRNLNLPSGGNNLTRGIAFKEDKLTGIAGSSSTPNIAKTINGGLNWLNIDVGNTINHLGPIIRWIEGTNICYLTAKEPSLIGGVMSGVLKSTDGGLNWTPMTTSDLGIIYMDTKRIGSNIYGYSISAMPGAFGGSQVLKLTDVVVVGTLTLTINFQACTTTDTITVELRSSTSPFNLIESRTGQGGLSIPRTISFNNTVDGTPYYLVVKHRNSIETWSAAPVIFTSGLTSYDFTADQTQTFGNNSTLVGSEWSIYTGDVNQDGIVDASDLSLIDNDAFNGVTGHVPTDLNCDEFVDLADLSFADNNAYNIILTRNPINGDAVIKYSQSVGILQTRASLPEKFSLSQNYPNPFNPVTVIR